MEKLQIVVNLIDGLNLLWQQQSRFKYSTVEKFNSTKY